MGWFDIFTKDIAIDLGTANTLIMHGDKVVVDEPSIVALDRATNKVIAVGNEALQMHEKTHEQIKTVRPLRDGVIADFKVAEFMIREFIKRLDRKGSLFGNHYRMVICIPSGITEVEERAVRDSAEHAGAKEAKLIYEPMAAAVGIGIDVSKPVGQMIVDIGGGTTEIAVIALSGIVCEQSIRVAGDDFNSDILDYMRRHHNLVVGEKSADRIKLEVGSALKELDDEPAPIEIQGKDSVSGIPRKITISYKEVAEALDKTINQIEEAVIRALELTPPELSADIYETGIHLTGGGALLRGLDKRLSQRTKLPVHVADNPLQAVVRGTAYVLRDLDKYKHLLK